MSSEAFALSLTKAATSTALINMIGILCIHLCIRSAFNKASEAEKKKQEFKRQKTFLLGFSHELRNLINSLMGNVKLASFEDISEKAKDFLRNADVCGELLIHLVNNILDTGKVEIGDLEINPIPVDIYDTLERIWSVCSELIKRKNLNGTMRIHKDLPKVVKIDHYRLTQIFLNLIGNATKFTENGSIDVTVEWISNTEKVNAECFEPRPFDDDDELSEGIFEKCKSFSVLDENFLVLTTSHKKNNRNLLIPIQSTNRGILKVVVNDTGCGISKENVTKLFQKFTQVTSDLSKRKLGTGLGLFITKELCERMNGEIRVFSKENKGSCFMFCLPVDPIIEEVRSPLKGSNRVEVRAQRRLKAMVVDDIPFCHTVLKNYFQLLDIDVSGIAENGLEAYRKYVDYANKKEYLHIVTMDLDMPVMNGKKSAEKIREFEAEKGIENCFMVIVSANCTESEIKECLDINGKMKANAFLKKPVNISELSRIISEQFKQESPRFSN
jgi:signal transduction histidine kinase/CheY-like chemotaxis protein